MNPVLHQTTGDVLTEVRDGVAWIRLNRPDRANAIGRAQYRAVRAALVAADEEPTVELVILAATGRHFCAGGDLSDLQGVFTDPRAYVDEAFAFYSQFLTMRKLVIAAVQGGVYTVGAIAVAGCDMVVAAESSYLCLPETEVGLWEPYTVSLLASSIGVKRAKRMVFTGERVPAPQLVDWGLYDRVVAEDQLEQEAAELAQQIIATSPQAREAYKRMANSHIAPWDIRIPIECLHSADSALGVEAFVTKTQPYWKEPGYWARPAGASPA